MRRFRIADPEHRVLLCLNSNGHLVTAETARALVGLADEVRVSLDGMRDRNDRMRGSGSFDAAVRALECFHAVGFEPKVLITVTSITVPDLEDLIGFLADRRITRINVNMFRPIGRGFGRNEWCVEPRSLYDAVRRVWLRYWPERPFSERVESGCQTHCGVGRFLNIMPNGDVFPCHVLMNPGFRCGNVRSRSLSEICQRTGLVCQLAELDFRDLVRLDDDLAELTSSGTCMGTVYARTESSRVWRARLSLGQN